MAEPIGQLLQSGCETRTHSPALEAFLRSCFVARGDFSADRLATTDGLSPAKWTSSFGIAHLERTLRPPDQNGFVHDLGKGAQSLLEYVGEDC